MTDPMNPTPPADPAAPPTTPPPLSPPWAVPAGALPPGAQPPGAAPSGAMPPDAPVWAFLPSTGWVQLAAMPATPPQAWSPPAVPQVTPQPQAPAPSWPSATAPTEAQPWPTQPWEAPRPAPGSPPSAPPPPTWSQPSPWAVAAPVASVDRAVPAVAPALPLEPVVRSSAGNRRRGRPSAYAMALGVAALLCVGGVGFAAGRMSAPESTDPSAAALAALAARNGFTPGQGVPSTTTDTADTTGTGTTTGAGSGTTTDTDTPTASLAPDLSGGQGTPGQGGFPGGPGGFGGFGLTGTVTAVGDGTITIETQNGTQEITTDDATTYHLEQPATAQDVTVGTSVRVTTSGGFPGRGGSQTDPSVAITASDVLVLEP